MSRIEMLDNTPTLKVVKLDTPVPEAKTDDADSLLELGVFIEHIKRASIEVLFEAQEKIENHLNYLQSLQDNDLSKQIEFTNTKLIMVLTAIHDRSESA